MADKATKKYPELTDLENDVVSSIQHGDEYDGMPSSCIDNVVRSVKKSPKIIRGVLSSLVQKNIIEMADLFDGCPTFILLKDKKYYI